MIVPPTGRLGVAPGEEGIFTVHVRANPQPNSFTWTVTHVGKPEQELQGKVTQIDGKTNSTIVIPNIGAIDYGNYSCTITNAIDQVRIALRLVEESE